MGDLVEKSIQELSTMVVEKQVSPVEIVKDYVSRIEETEPQINAYITTLEKQAIQLAQKSEDELMKGKYYGRLHGIPYSLKDIYFTKGIKTTMGSKVFADYIPTEDATTYVKLKESGAILLGKNNTNEFAMGPTNENPHYGPVRNPWNVDCISGGSSGGSGASVAASSSAFSLGSDTGGSIRIPASLCGVVGIKPTFGLVSKKGIFVNSFSLDHAGPLCKTVWDAALVLETIAGYDSLDCNSMKKEIPSYTNGLEEMKKAKPLQQIKVGICEAYYFEHLDEQVAKHVHAAVRMLEGLGAEIVPISIPHIKESAEIQSILSNPEGAAYHSHFFEKHIEKYSPEVRDRINNGRSIPAWTFVNAQRIRSVIAQEFKQALQQVDVIVGPTTGITAFPIGKETCRVNGLEFNPRKTKQYFTKTSPANQAGLPAISVPCGVTEQGLPIGLQIIGDLFAEQTILNVAYAFEQHTEWHKKRPTFTSSTELIKM